MTKPGASELKVNIQIDRKHYQADADSATGVQLRVLAEPDVGADRDLFLVVPGGQDQKIGDDQEVPLKSGMRFFTAPGQINPGKFVGRSPQRRA